MTAPLSALSNNQSGQQKTSGSKFTFSFKPKDQETNGQADKQTESSKGEDKQLGSLFGGNNTQFGAFRKSQSLFGGQPSTTTGNLFGNFPATNLFKAPSADAKFLFGDKPVAGGSLFGQTKSLFDDSKNKGGLLFANSSAGDGDAKEDQEDKDDGESQPVYGDSQSPDRVLPDKEIYKSPFEKIYEIEADKFKVVKPEAEARSCGIGRISIHKGEFDGSGAGEKFFVYKLIYKNCIGKTLYESTISAKHSKMRPIPEKAYKNQLKVAVINTK